jgi:hypothetical protein
VGLLALLVRAEGPRPGQRLSDGDALRLKLQLRFEVFNLFNTVNFLGYSLNTAYNAENVVLDTGDAATATKILSAAPPGNFGQLTAARDTRTVQLGIRLAF